MKIEQVKAVVEIYRCAALHGHSASPEQIHKLMLLAARIKRLTADGIAGMSERQGRAFERAMSDATVIGRAVGAIVRVQGGLVLVWMNCGPTTL